MAKETFLKIKLKIKENILGQHVFPFQKRRDLFLYIMYNMFILLYKFINNFISKSDKSINKIKLLLSIANYLQLRNVF